MSSLFGDLPSAKNSSKDNNHPNGSSISGNDHHHNDGSNASDKKDIKVATQERKQEIIKNDSISSSAASKKKSSMPFAFVPAALRTKKISKQTNVAHKPKVGGVVVAAATVQKVERTTLVTKAEDDPTCKSRNMLKEEKDAEKDNSRDDDNDDREEEIRQLHLAVSEAETNMSEQKQRQANLSFDYSWIDVHKKITPYDPMMPNDFLAYKEGQKKRRAREQLERNTRESLKRQEAMRERIEEERRKIEASGDIDAIVANREKHRREIHSVAESGQAHSGKFLSLFDNYIFKVHS